MGLIESEENYYFRDELLPLFADDSLLMPTQEGEYRHPALKWETGDQAVWNAFFYDKQYRGEVPDKWPLFFSGKAFSRGELREEHP